MVSWVRATTEDLSLTIHAKPTLPEPLMEAVEGVMGHAPLLKKIIRTFNLTGPA